MNDKKLATEMILDTMKLLDSPQNRGYIIDNHHYNNILTKLAIENDGVITEDIIIKASKILKEGNE